LSEILLNHLPFGRACCTATWPRFGSINKFFTEAPGGKKMSVRILVIVIISLSLVAGSFSPAIAQYESDNIYFSIYEKPGTYGQLLITVEGFLDNPPVKVVFTSSDPIVDWLPHCEASINKVSCDVIPYENGSVFEGVVVNMISDGTEICIRQTFANSPMVQRCHMLDHSQATVFPQPTQETETPVPTDVVTTTVEPSKEPTLELNPEPTEESTPVPTTEPTDIITMTVEPTQAATEESTPQPTEMTLVPTEEPTLELTPEPTEVVITLEPGEEATEVPTEGTTPVVLPKTPVPQPQEPTALDVIEQQIMKFDLHLPVLDR
jgi:hypothetical protein